MTAYYRVDGEVCESDVLVREYKNGRRDVVLVDGRKVKVGYGDEVFRCADCGELILSGGSVALISLMGDGTEHLHRACEQARCGYCSGRGTLRTRGEDGWLDAGICPECGGDGKNREDGT